MSDSRREFLKHLGKFSALCLVGLVSCGKKQPREVKLQDLIESPETYYGKEIETSGWLEYVGKKKYLIPYQYYNPRFDSIRIKLISFILNTYRLYPSPNSKKYFTIVSRTPINNKVAFEKIIKIRGLVESDGNRTYFLNPLQIES